ncbi:hypothetical protein NLJ89_g11411 [Agrocybe chaxingu]|uniref:PhoD-like phosphatase metallophosphatase domain-containing protein n=1 Tax=Agrocybe chaxingu TaxID=84603 RepID=A0A9W8MQ13_9AGAR|nr:hypothetical protein NLJ89_g11411 [Agrocybe chaxingu]
MRCLPAALSTLFRLAAFLFIEIIPTRLGPPVLPTLYVLYLVTAYLFHPEAAPLPKDEKTNGAAVHETPTPPPSAPSPLSVLILSLPTTSRVFTLINVLINTLLVLASADLILTPFLDTATDITFTRLGAVYPDSVKIQARYPFHDNSTDNTLLILYRQLNASAWKHGPHLHPTQESDWVDTVRLANLWPSTSYEYIIADINSTILPIASAPIPFRTFPDPRLHSGSRFRFVATSCTTPNFPYRGPFNKRTITGFDLLADYLTPSPPSQTVNATDAYNSTTQNITTTLQPPIVDKPSTDFLLFLGDFIYADVPVYIGDDKEAYRRLYRRNYASPSFRKIYEQLPIIHAYDDHEFINNYAGNSEQAPPFVNASGAYNIYAAKPNYDPVHPDQSFYNFQHGDVAFFVMDTRRYRSPSNGPDQTYRTMLGEAQLTALQDWLHAVNETASFKFIVSSVPFTSLWTHDAQIDSWAGYPLEKAALLQAFHSVPNVVVISGDRHEFAVVEYNTPDPSKHIVREISTSPLNMFYIPFIHTLRPRSEEAFNRTVSVSLSEDGTETIQKTEQVPFERAISYIPKGNSKWSTFDIDTKNRKKPTLRLETVIDGKPAYHLEILGEPARLPNFAGLGSLLPGNVMDMFDKLGFKPGRWF